MKKILLISSILLAGMFSTAFAQAKNEPAKSEPEVSNEPGWHKIASTAVELSVGQDVVAIFVTDKFKALHVKSTGHGIHIKSLRVFYENGAFALLDVNSRLNAGETSKDFILDKYKNLRKIAYVYNAEPNENNEMAHLELYGLK